MTGQNTSSAVMAQRKEPHDSLDDFPTMPWGTRAVIEYAIIGQGERRDTLAKMSCWEPAANRGFMARPLAEYFKTVHTSDVHDYGAGYDVHDFLQPYTPKCIKRIDWVFTNPPFRIAKQFIQRGLEIARVGVAVVVRTSFLESKDRYENLYRDTPPNIVAPFVERIPMFKGRIDPAGSTATSYAWLIWQKRPPVPGRGTQLIWIPPCRKALEREGDYE